MEPVASPQATKASRPNATLLVVVGAAFCGTFWWVMADAAFEGNARSLFLVDLLAFAFTFPFAWFAASSWQGRLKAWGTIVVLTLIGLATFWLVWNMTHPGSM